MAINDLPALLAAKPKPGLLRRYVTLVRPEPKAARAEEVLKIDVLRRGTECALARSSAGSSATCPYGSAQGPLTSA